MILVLNKLLIGTIDRREFRGVRNIKVPRYINKNRSDSTDDCVQ